MKAIIADTEGICNMYVKPAQRFFFSFFFFFYLPSRQGTSKIYFLSYWGGKKGGARWGVNLA